MAEIYQELLREILLEKAELDERIHPPLGLAVDQTDDLFRRILDTTCDPDFHRLCVITNGLDWNGLVLYSILNPGEDRARNVFDNNIEWRENEGMSAYVIFGDNGMDLIAKNSSTGGFELLMKPSFDSVETFESFADVLANQLEQFR